MRWRKSAAEPLTAGRNLEPQCQLSIQWSVPNVDRVAKLQLLYWQDAQAQWRKTLCELTLSLGTDQAGWRVAEGAQNGSYGQAQVLVARVQGDRGEAQVRQTGRLLRTNFYMRDLAEETTDI